MASLAYIEECDFRVSSENIIYCCMSAPLPKLKYSHNRAHLGTRLSKYPAYLLFLSTHLSNSYFHILTETITRVTLWNLACIFAFIRPLLTSRVLLIMDTENPRLARNLP